LERSDASGETAGEVSEAMEAKHYLAVLQESLEKKKRVLSRIIQKNTAQRLILLEESIDADSFERNLEEKEALIEELNQLDEGFEQIYQRVKVILSGHQSEYAEQIGAMQGLITEITEQSTQIQVQEQRNKELAQQRFADSKEKIRQVKVSRQVASQYYKNMSKVNYVDPQFMDRKK
jgi:hypothetical protein